MTRKAGSNRTGSRDKEMENDAHPISQLHMLESLPDKHVGSIRYVLAKALKRDKLGIH